MFCTVGVTLEVVVLVAGGEGQAGVRVGPGGEVVSEAQAGVGQPRVVVRVEALGLGHDGAGAHGDARVEHPDRGAEMVLALAEAPVLVEGGGSAEHLAAVFALDLRAAVGVHALVAAQVGELCV